jgi:hypothetical protein
MPVPAWRPMPKTVEDPSEPGYAEGSRIRAAHRTLMALRWRSKEARDEDRKARRLPDDWHDWMNCPGVDQGYATQACTCDKPLCQHPRELVKRERDLRKKLSEELRFSFKDRQRADLEGRKIATNDIKPFSAVLWVKTIDTPITAPYAPARRLRAYGAIKSIEMVSQDAPTVARYPSASASHTGSSVSTRSTQNRLKGSVRLRIPAWFAAARRALPFLFGNCGTAR